MRMKRKLIGTLQPAAREMVIDDLYNEGKRPWGKDKRHILEIVITSRRPWDKDVHGEILGHNRARHRYGYRLL